MAALQSFRRREESDNMVGTAHPTRLNMQFWHLAFFIRPQHTLLELQHLRFPIILDRIVVMSLHIVTNIEKDEDDSEKIVCLVVNSYII